MKPRQAEKIGRNVKMKYLTQMIVLYCIVHGASGDFAVSYDGVDRKTAAQLIQQTYGAPFDFVDQPTHEAYVMAHRPHHFLKASTPPPVTTSTSK